ncbi:MAG: Rpn family recombination-promoting nuclease/putative transposase, partial [Pirellulaceae bacterium]|nr:Rpn family recombination-promoting nuclease/putative transposase [Pirellulaceae bacterium]
EKIVVLDVLARDGAGRLFNIEMQTRLPLSFPSRLLYYNCKNYWRQLREGDGYTTLRPAISICLIDRLMFQMPSAASRWHNSFRLRCDQDSDLVLTDDLEFHIFELPKFRPTSDNIDQLPAEQKWLYLFTHATQMEPDELSDLLGGEPYRKAIGVLEMISKTPEDYQYYEDRLKFLRDEEGKLLAAREEGEQLGMVKGEQLGMVKGEQLGLLKGELSKIQMLQGLLGDPVSPFEELLSYDGPNLTSLLDSLQDRLRTRLD